MPGLQTSEVTDDIARQRESKKVQMTKYRTSKVADETARDKI